MVPTTANTVGVVQGITEDVQWRFVRSPFLVMVVGQAQIAFIGIEVKYYEKNNVYYIGVYVGTNCYADVFCFICKHVSRLMGGKNCI